MEKKNYLASRSTSDLSSTLKNRVMNRINELETESKKLRIFLSELDNVVGKIEHKRTNVQFSPSKSIKSNSRKSSSNIHTTDPSFIPQLIQISKEHGTIAIANLSKYFRANEWRKDLGDSEIIRNAEEILNKNPQIFEKPKHGYYQLTSSAKRRTSKGGSAATFFNKKPLVEFIYDVMKDSKHEVMPLADITLGVKRKGYKSFARTPLGTLVCQLLRKDNRFIRIEPARYSLVEKPQEDSSSNGESDDLVGSSNVNV